MKKNIALLCVIFITFSAKSNNLTLRESIVTDPSVSRRCESLINKRSRKVKHRQRLTHIAQRNKKLRKVTPKNKVSIEEVLNNNLREVIKEIKLTNLIVQQIEEKIIRRGCPGLSL